MIIDIFITDCIFCLTRDSPEFSTFSCSLCHSVSWTIRFSSIGLFADCQAILYC